MFSDFHTHTQFSGDCEVPVKVQLDQAVRLGMKEICVTDHHDYGVVSDLDFRLDIDSYLIYMKQMQELYKHKIRVNIGIELGLQLRVKDYLSHLVETYDFDFIIGSSHFVDGIDLFLPSFYEGRSERAAYEQYFETTLARLKELDCFDVFGHLDYVVRYGPTKGQNYSYFAYKDHIDPILTKLIEKGKGLECNTGGYHYQLGHPNPCEDILRRYRELGGEILTIGSDGHTPAHLGYHFDKLATILSNCGFRYYTVFHNREAEFVKI